MDWPSINFVLLILLALLAAAGITRVVMFGRRFDKTADDVVKAHHVLQMKFDRVADCVLKLHEVTRKKLDLQLKFDAFLSRRLADYTKEPGDIEVADAVEKTYRDFVASG